MNKWSIKVRISMKKKGETGMVGDMLMLLVLYRVEQWNGKEYEREFISVSFGWWLPETGTRDLLSLTTVCCTVQTDFSAECQ